MKENVSGCFFSEHSVYLLQFQRYKIFPRGLLFWCALYMIVLMMLFIVLSLNICIFYICKMF